MLARVSLAAWLKNNSMFTTPLRFISRQVATTFRDRIHLNGMIFFARHGVHREEQILGQKFRVDVEISADLRNVQDDNLDSTIDYGRVYDAVRQVVTSGKPRRLVESVAEDIARNVLNDFEKAEIVRVKVLKPHVSVEGVIDGLGVEIVRTREDFS